jgi:hypothetical protein
MRPTQTTAKAVANIGGRQFAAEVLISMRDDGRARGRQGRVDEAVLGLTRLGLHEADRFFKLASDGGRRLARDEPGKHPAKTAFRIGAPFGALCLFPGTAAGNESDRSHHLG